MRIVAGRLGGRLFEAPPGHRTHPMSEKIRGALFNILGDIEGLAVLDAFAGSGALGFEALSRGAARVVAIESDLKAYKTILTNSLSLGIEKNCKTVHANVSTWLSRQNQIFDIVLCDPPYDRISNDLLTRLSARTKKEGVIVYSLPPKTGFGLDAPFVLLKIKEYGDASLVIYRNTG